MHETAVVPAQAPVHSIEQAQDVVRVVHTNAPQTHIQTPTQPQPNPQKPSNKGGRQRGWRKARGDRFKLKVAAEAVQRFQQDGTVPELGQVDPMPGSPTHENDDSGQGNGQ